MSYWKKRIKFVFYALRLPFLLIYLSGVVVGAISVTSFTPYLTFMSVLYALPLTFTVLGLNDYFDREIDQDNRETGLFKGPIVDEEWQKNLLQKGIIVSIALVLLTLPFVSLYTKSLLLSALLLGFMYSVPPVRLKSIPIVDAVANGVSVLLIFALGVSLAGEGFSAISSKAYWAAMIFMPMVAMGSCPDREADRRNGLKTTGMLLGWRGTAVWLALAITAALIFENWPLVPKIGMIGAIITSGIMMIKPREETFYNVLKLGFAIGVPVGTIWLATITGII